MRRNEFNIIDQDRISRFMMSRNSGILTLISDTAPYSVPMNYAWDDGRILMHSALEGRKVPLLRSERQAQFTVYKEYSVIPSFFSHGRAACNATQFFTSVMVFGPTGEISAPHEKAEVLNTFMNQIQGKGTFPPISADDQAARPMLDHVGVFYLKAESVTAKFKAGQNLSDERAEQIIESLLNRGTPLDIETVELMREMRKQEC